MSIRSTLGTSAPSMWITAWSIVRLVTMTGSMWSLCQFPSMSVELTRKVNLRNSAFGEGGYGVCSRPFACSCHLRCRRLRLRLLVRVIGVLSQKFIPAFFLAVLAERIV